MSDTTTRSECDPNHADDFANDMYDLLDWTVDHVTAARHAVGVEGCAVLESLLRARSRIDDAIACYLAE